MYRGDLSRTSSFYSTPPSSVCLNASYENDEEICFPDYNDTPFRQPQPTMEMPASPAPSASVEEPSSPISESTPTNDSAPTSPGLVPVVDDTAVREEPSRQVDYLSHDWREEDIWSSWRHIVSKRRVYGERSRLENASWRTWAKSKYNLKTVSPETLNWCVQGSFLSSLAPLTDYLQGSRTAMLRGCMGHSSHHRRRTPRTSRECR